MSGYLERLSRRVAGLPSVVRPAAAPLYGAGGDYVAAADDRVEADSAASREESSAMGREPHAPSHEPRVSRALSQEMRRAAREAAPAPAGTRELRSSRSAGEEDQHAPSDGLRTWRDGAKPAAYNPLYRNGRPAVEPLRTGEFSESVASIAMERSEQRPTETRASARDSFTPREQRALSRLQTIQAPQATPHTPAAPVVRISIGRVEVRAVHAPPTAPPVVMRAPEASLNGPSLAEYLNGPRGGGR